MSNGQYRQLERIKIQTTLSKSGINYRLFTKFRIIPQKFHGKGQIPRLTLKFPSVGASDDSISNMIDSKETTQTYIPVVYALKAFNMFLLKSSIAAAFFRPG